MGSKLKGVNFHQHSCYSYLDGASLPNRICERAKELGFKYACISDHGNVAGHVNFYDEARKRDLIPVLGSELYFVDSRSKSDRKYDNGKPKGYHLTIWALTEEGLHNVWAISSNTYYATGEGHRNPNTTWEDIEGYGKGVACSSACIASALSAAALANDYEMADYFASRYVDIFDEFYIELHTNSMDKQRKVNLWLMDYAKSRGYKVVYAVDSHYADAEDAEFHDTWLGCQTKAYYNEDHWKMDHEYYIQGEDEIARRLAYLGDDLQLVFDGIDDFLSKVEPYEIKSSRKVPKFPLPEGWTDNKEYLKYLLLKGLLRKVAGKEIVPNEPGEPYNKIKYRGAVTVRECNEMKKYIDQLFQVELPLIFDNDLTDYFLITSDYCRWAKSNGILLGPGRGSCVGSVLCYLLDITEVSPIGKGLYFSRFLNSGRLDRGTLPDIDTDVPGSKKGELQSHLSELYGSEYVTAVGVTLFFGIKLALKEVCRYYKVPVSDANRMTKIAEALEELAGDGDWKAQIPQLGDSDREFLEGYLKSFPDIFAKADRMVGLARSAGKHAAGYVISPEPLARLLPIRRSDNDEIITQFDKRVVERLGFLKADLLGLRNLDTLQMASDLVKERSGEEIDYYGLAEAASDDPVWQVFDKGDTLGVFQLEGTQITNLTKELKPRSIKDIATILSLYRPGIIYAKMPDGTGMLENYVLRSKGEKDVEYLTPELEPILNETYGVIVFQEQIIQIVQQLGGFTEAEADSVRAAIGHKEIEVLKATRPKFVSGCKENGISESAANAIFDQMEVSGDYLFNLSHAIGYGTVTYWTAWMKAHHPLEFYTACMSTVATEKAPLYMREAGRRGIKIVPPSVVNPSGDYAILADDEIAVGLANVKGCGAKAIEKIVANAPYADFEDFVSRSKCNSAVMKALVKGGFFREWCRSRMYLLYLYDSKSYAGSLFGDDPLARDDAPDYTLEEIEEIETEIYGMSLSVDAFQPRREALGDAYRFIESMEEISDAPFDTDHILLIKVTDVRKRPSKRGEMAFLIAITDKGEELEATVFSDTYKITRQWLHKGDYAAIFVRKQNYNGRQSLVVNRVQPC